MNEQTSNNDRAGSALDVLAELISIRSGGGDFATRLDREQDAWNRAGELVARDEEK